MSDALFSQAFSPYTKRLNKGWSLIDCVSFVVMNERGMSKLTTSKFTIGADATAAA